jgi:hypothetical protein
MKNLKLILLTTILCSSITTAYSETASTLVVITGNGVTSCAVASPAINVGTVIANSPSAFIYSTSIIVNCNVPSTLSTDALKYALTVGGDSTTNKIEATKFPNGLGNIFSSPIALSAVTGQQSVPFYLKLSNGATGSPSSTGSASATLNMVLTY